MDRLAGDNNDDQGDNNAQPHWTQQQQNDSQPRPAAAELESRSQQTHHPPPPPPPAQQQPPCPRCSSTDTKFGYYNNYSLTQPRYFCKGCKRYWTHGGALRNIPVGGGSRKAPKRPRLSPAKTSPPPPPLQQQLSFSRPPPPPQSHNEGSGRFDPVSSSSSHQVIHGKALQIGEGSSHALSLPLTTALSVSPPSSSSSPLMINYLNPNYHHHRQLPPGRDVSNDFFTSLVGFQGQPLFTEAAAGRGSILETSASSAMNNLGPLFHFSVPYHHQVPRGWRPSYVTAGVDHPMNMNQPVSSSVDAMFRRLGPGLDSRHDDGGAKVKQDDDDGGGGSGRGTTEQQPDTSKYG